MRRKAKIRYTYYLLIKVNSYSGKENGSGLELREL